MKKFYALVVCMFFSWNCFAVKDGDTIITATIYVHKKTGASIKLAQHKFKFEHNDKEHRSKKKTAWQVSIRDKRGRVLDAGYIRFVLDDGADIGSQNPVNPKEVQTKNVNEIPEYPYDYAIFVSKFRKEYYEVNVLEYGVIKASELIKNAEHY